jgi:5'(3')-deoxyribonucleotidase
MTRKILYIDMDNVLVDFPSGIALLPDNVKQEYEGRLDDVPGLFALMKPRPKAIESFNCLASLYDTYILSTAPWKNPSAWSDKLLWVQAHLGQAAYKRLIISHHKELNAGHYLVDDRTKNGADRFPGEHILFGSERFPDWDAVVGYLRSRAT